ncbi:hypothetical protein J6590_047043 [Homalodisca vitripennis]|nr:hypothetical protein J6590_047043 [Homalodisca vitripennis]
MFRRSQVIALCARGGYVLLDQVYFHTGRDNHGTAAFAYLSSQGGVRPINKLPERIKQTGNPNHIRARLKRQLMVNAFYSGDEFNESRWDI